MKKGKLEKLIKKNKLIIIPGAVYDVYDCCIFEHVKESNLVTEEINGKLTMRAVCPTHGGHFITKFKYCQKCGELSIGLHVRKGKTCSNCRKPAWVKKYLEHPRGRYCKNYNVEESGCSFCDDCWYCEIMNPWFKGTGPKIRKRPKIN